MKKFVLWIVFVGSVFVLQAQDPPSPFAGGSGTAEAPYQITNLLELDSVRRYLSSHFILMKDLDFDSDDPAITGGYTPFSAMVGWGMIARDLDPSDYGTFDGPGFTGGFDGNDKTISNLRINVAFIDLSNVGFFGVISGEAVIKDLGLLDVNVIGAVTVGGLVGLLADGLIENCYVTGSVAGDLILGGLAGVSFSRIENCYSTADVTGNGYCRWPSRFVCETALLVL